MDSRSKKDPNYKSNPLSFLEPVGKFFSNLCNRITHKKTVKVRNITSIMFHYATKATEISYFMFF